MALRDLFVRMGISIDQTPLRDTQREVNSTVIAFRQLQRIAGFAVAALGVGTLIQTADEYINLTNRLRAVTKSTEEFETAQRGVFDIARKTFTPVEDVAALYQRFTLVTDHLGKSQREVLDFTQQLTMAMKLGGSTAAEARGALIQFGQGLGNNFKSGGQELNSIIEQAPILAKILADAAGGTVADLKQLARDGKLSAEVIFEAMKRAQPELEKRFIARAKSFEDVKVAFGIEWLAFMKQLEPLFTKVTRAMLDTVTATKEWIDRGEAMNNMIAGLIVVAGALTVAFGGLAIQLLLAAAPFVALFLIIEDFVTFLRGGDSLVGDFFEAFLGPGGAAKAKETILELWDILKQIFTNPGQIFKEFGEFFQMVWNDLYNGAVRWIDQTIELVKKKAPEIGDAIADSIRGVLGETASDLLGIESSGSRAAKREQVAIDNALQSAADRTAAMNDKWKWPFPRDEQAEIDNALQSAADRTAAMNDKWKWPFPRDEQADIGAALQNAADRTQAMQTKWAGYQTSADKALANVNITNQITVQGSATPEVARDIAGKTGDATADAIGGRDMSAVGASFGMAQ